MTGRVVSTKNKGTVTVLVERIVMHPLYKKTYKQSKKYLVDDSLGVKMGDIVDIINCKPVSKTKHWKVVSVLGRNFAEIANQQMKEKAEEVIAEVILEEKESKKTEEKVEKTEKVKKTHGSKNKKEKKQNGTA